MLLAVVAAILQLIATYSALYGCVRAWKIGVILGMLAMAIFEGSA